MEIEYIVIDHQLLGFDEASRTKHLKRLIKKRAISLAGNRKLNIYGKLNCKSGRRLKVANRVFFKDEAAALMMGYRPCAHCLLKQYQIYKSQKKSK